MPTSRPRNRRGVRRADAGRARPARDRRRRPAGLRRRRRAGARPPVGCQRGGRRGPPVQPAGPRRRPGRHAAALAAAAVGGGSAWPPCSRSSDEREIGYPPSTVGVPGPTPTCCGTSSLRAGRSDRIAVIGANGSGKSTFARTAQRPGHPDHRATCACTASTRSGRPPNCAAASASCSATRTRRSSCRRSPRTRLLAARPTGCPGPRSRERVAAAHGPVRPHRVTPTARPRPLRRPEAAARPVRGVDRRARSLVVADEPTAYLDAANSRRIAGFLLDEMPQQLVLVTHDLGLAARCDIAVRFEGGRLAARGPGRGHRPVRARTCSADALPARRQLAAPPARRPEAAADWCWRWPSRCCRRTPGRWPARPPWSPAATCWPGSGGEVGRQVLRRVGWCW